jgi:hypothetical protein
MNQKNMNTQIMFLMFAANILMKVSFSLISEQEVVYCFLPKINIKQLHMPTAHRQGMT